MAPLAGYRVRRGRTHQPLLLILTIFVKYLFASLPKIAMAGGSAVTLGVPMSNAKAPREERQSPLEPGSEAAGGKTHHPSARSVRVINAKDLLGRDREAIIDLDGQEYRLRITSNGKLILTK